MSSQGARKIDQCRKLAHNGKRIMQKSHNEDLDQGRRERSHVEFTTRDRLLILQAWRRIPNHGSRKAIKSSAAGRNFAQWLAAYYDSGVALRGISGDLPVTPQYLYLLARWGRNLRTANPTPPTIAEIRVQEVVEQELPVKSEPAREGGRMTLEYIAHQIWLFEERNPNVVIHLKVSIRDH